jgi:acylphosphatase
MNTASVSRQVIYHGRVQGVGFRMTARRIARRFPVTGSVRNLPDGTVELIAVGNPGPVQEFLAAVAHAMEGHIERAETGPGPPDPDLPSFEIAD